MFFGPSIGTEPSFRRTGTELLFEFSGYFRPGDLHPAGERFALVRNDIGGPGINVGLNWFEELTERVPVPQ